MKSHKRIWILLTVIILLTTVVSGIIWNYHGRSRYEEVKINIEEITNSAQIMKSDLEAIKSIKPDFKVQTIELNNSEKAKKYSGEGGQEILVEYFNRDGFIIRIDFDTNKDGKKDVTEHYQTGNALPNVIEYDTDGDGKADVIERDTNKDGIIDVTEMEINIDGKFMPLSSFGNIII